MEFVTVTSTGPIAPDGEIAEIDVAELTVTPVAPAPPNWTATPVVVKFVPVIVTAIPPVVAPLFGLTPVTVGNAVSE